MEQQTAVISGSTRGIGFAIAKQLINLHYNVIITSRNEKELTNKTQELNKLNKGTAYGYVCDFSDQSAIRAFARKITTRHSPITVLVNNVGQYLEDTIFSGNAMQNTLSLFQINVLSAVALTHYLVEELKKHHSNIINIGSVLSSTSRSNALSYTISKHALTGFSKSLRYDLNTFNIQITDILPESVNTSSWDGIEAPKETFIQPEEIAQIVADVITLKTACFDVISIKNK